MSNRVFLTVALAIACAAGTSRASDDIGAVIVTERPVLKSDRYNEPQIPAEFGNAFAYNWSSPSSLDRVTQFVPGSAPISPNGYLGSLSDLAPDLATVYGEKRTLVIPGGSRNATLVNKPVLFVVAPVLLIFMGGVLFVRLRQA